jgi:DNA-binding NarL/FixJ family response regulator
LAGEWEKALRLTGHALVIAHRQSNRRSVALALIIRGLILAHRGDLTQARGCVTDARTIFGHGDQHAVSTIDTVAGVVALIEGRTADALNVLEQVSPVNYLGLLTLTVQTTAAARAGDLDRLDRVAAQVGVASGPWAAALTRRVSGLRGRDQAALIDACNRLAVLGMPYESASVQLETAELESPGIDASQRASAALATFERLGAGPAADRARRLLRSLGHRAPPGRPTRGSLSERERQVAELVAQGLSNADVAARLFISPRTVTTHLERIYRRLGLSSRAELSRYVVEQTGPALRTATDTGGVATRTD